MIYGILGRMRSGKGILATKFAHEHWLRGYTIISNMTMFFNGKDKAQTSITLNLDVLEDAMQKEKPLGAIYNTQKVCLLLDELMILMDSRASMSKENKGLSYLAAQSAKMGVEIIYTSQLNTGVDTRMRTFAHSLTQCNKLKITIPNLTTGETEQYIVGFEFDVIDNEGIIPDYTTTFGMTAEQAKYYMDMYYTEQQVKSKIPNKN